MGRSPHIIQLDSIRLLLVCVLMLLLGFLIQSTQSGTTVQDNTPAQDNAQVWVHPNTPTHQA